MEASGPSAVEAANANARAMGRNYPGLDQHSIRYIWEQHDQSGVELSPEIYTALAEDASYKLWEMINNIKIYSRHSGGVVTYDLVNEVFRDADIPPALGAMDSDWERIDYDDTFFFYSDRIIELREEYQRDTKIPIADGPDFTCSFPVLAEKLKPLSSYASNLLHMALFGEVALMDKVLTESAFSPIVGSCFREILNKITQTIAFKQSSYLSKRCWRLLRALSLNPYLRGLECRLECFHLAEVLICQLLGPYEKIKDNSNSMCTEVKSETDLQLGPRIIREKARTPVESKEAKVVVKMEFVEPQEQLKVEPGGEAVEPSEELDAPLPEEKVYKLITNESGITEMVESTVNAVEAENLDKMELDIKQEAGVDTKSDIEQQNSDDNYNGSQSEKIYKLILDDDEEMDKDSKSEVSQQNSGFTATPIEHGLVDDLCRTCGCVSAMNCYFQRECIFNITRRLERFFCGRHIRTNREFQFISRAVRGLISLGEYAFREFTPFIYKLDADKIPEHLWADFAIAGLYVRGPDDIFLYEWLDFVCGGDKLQPFMIYYAEYFEKFILHNYMGRKRASFKIYPKVVPRRLEWNALAAAMCHGDDPNRALKPKPTIEEMFPELVAPVQPQTEPNTRMRFKFSGCRPVGPKQKPIQKPQQKSHAKNTDELTALCVGDATNSSCSGPPYGQNDIVIARRKLFKPLTNERRIIHVSSFYYTTL